MPTEATPTKLAVEPTAPEAKPTRRDLVVAWLNCPDDTARLEIVRKHPELVSIMSEARNFAK